MRAIITGVNGQDGSYLAELLLSKGYEVIGIIRRSSTNTTMRISHLLNNPKFQLVEGDVSDSSSVNSWFHDYGDIDECYNLAAMSHVATSFKQPKTTFDVDAIGVLNILEAIRNYSMITRFYQASTSEMFGSNYTMSHFGNFQDENTEFYPQSPYAIAKVAAHQMVQLYRKSYGIHASCGILFNHESERRGEQFVTRKITKWMGEYLAWFQLIFEQGLYATKDHTNYLYQSLCDRTGFPKLRLGNLDAYRDWGHAKDYVEGMWLMLQQERPDDYVLATGETHTIREFLKVAFTYAGLRDWKQYVVIDQQFVRPAEVDYLCGRADKAKKVLGWEPKVSFAQLVHLMVDHDKKEAAQKKN